MSERLKLAVLAVSLAANLVWWPQVADKLARSLAYSPDRTPRSAEERTGTDGPRTAPSTLAGRWTAQDLAVLRDWLLASGVEPDIAREVVAAELNRRFQAREFRLLDRAMGKVPWWSQATWYGGEDFEAMEALRQEMREERRRLLGEEAAPEDAQYLAAEYPGVAPAKRLALYELRRDYDRLRSELREESAGFSLPTDIERARLIAEEERRDLQALLTPEELAAYEERHSVTTRNLRFLFSGMDATEAEFRAVLALFQAHDDLHLETDMAGNWLVSRDDQAERRAREASWGRVGDQVKEVLGAERFKTYARAWQQDFRTLRDATRRFGLPATVPDRLYDFGQRIGAQSKRVLDDASLSPEQRRAELTRLADQMRAELRGTLGAEAGDTFLNGGGMAWLNELAAGRAVTFDDYGNPAVHRGQ